MLLGRVIGEVWTTQKSPALEGQKLVLVAPRYSYGGALGHDHVVALDKLGAGLGEEVLVCFGAAPRWEHGGTHMPIEAAVMGLVDRTELHTDDPHLPFGLVEAPAHRKSS